MTGQLDVDWDIVEKIGWAVLAFAAAEVCGEIAKTLREQRREGRDRTYRAALDDVTRYELPAPAARAQMWLLTSPGPQMLPVAPVTTPRAIRGQV